jgi:hypothetical protein
MGVTLFSGPRMGMGGRKEHRPGGCTALPHTGREEGKKGVTEGKCGRIVQTGFMGYHVLLVLTEDLE